MELLFISSPIGFLKVLIKENKLYSLSRVRKQDLFFLDFQTQLVPSFIKKIDSRANGIVKRKLQNSNSIHLATGRPFKSKKMCQSDLKFQVLPFNSLKESQISVKQGILFKQELSGRININSQEALNKKFSYLVDEKSCRIFQKKRQSALAQNIRQQLNLYFKGHLKKFNIPIYNRGTDFQKKVWRALQKIQWGRIKRYSQIAKELNKPKAYRAVGNSCAKNPFLIVVPCHRVLSGSGLGGFALGLKTKKYLLNLERAV